MLVRICKDIPAADGNHHHVPGVLIGDRYYTADDPPFEIDDKRVKAYLENKLPNGKPCPLVEAVVRMPVMERATAKVAERR